MTWPQLGRRILDALCMASFALCMWLAMMARRWHVRRMKARWRRLDALCVGLYALCIWLAMKAWRWYGYRMLSADTESGQEVEREDLEQRR